LNDKEITLQSVRDAIITIRQNKLPDPKILGNAGSFFMNPVVSPTQIPALKARYFSIPIYPAQGGNIKISAGWLIEQSGLKGFRAGTVGVYDEQALIIVNHGNATGKEIAHFAEYIRQTVYQKFGITLMPEVKYV
jgi:UDP-N-acetylmuramate dehydrogenase